MDPALAVTLTPYSYAGDDPVNQGDPSGRCGFICIGAAVGGITGAVTGALACTGWNSGCLASVVGGAAGGAIAGACIGAVPGLAAGAACGAIGAEVNDAVQMAFGQEKTVGEITADVGFGAIGGMALRGLPDKPRVVPAEQLVQPL